MCGKISCSSWVLFTMPSKYTSERPPPRPVSVGIAAGPGDVSHTRGDIRAGLQHHTVRPGRTDDRHANGAFHGLTFGLWTADAGRAHRDARAIRAETVWINSSRYLRASVPYGGFKLSGLGRENGPEGLDAFLETRAVIMSLTGTYPDPYT